MTAQELENFFAPEVEQVIELRDACRRLQTLRGSRRIVARNSEIQRECLNGVIRAAFLRSNARSRVRVHWKTHSQETQIHRNTTLCKSWFLVQDNRRSLRNPHRHRPDFRDIEPAPRAEGLVQRLPQPPTEGELQSLGRVANSSPKCTCYKSLKWRRLRANWPG